MITVNQLEEKLKSYLLQQVTKLSKDSPLMGLAKPIVTRIIDKNFSKVTKLFDLLSDESGNIDIESILSEMTESIINTNPFTVNTQFIGDIEIGGGHIKMQLPILNKSLVFTLDDFKQLKELLTQNS